MNTMAYKDYQGKFEYDQDAGIFHGEVLHLNDVVTFQGRSIDELKKHWRIQWKITCYYAKISARNQKSHFLEDLIYESLLNYTRRLQ